MINFLCGIDNEPSGSKQTFEVNSEAGTSELRKRKKTKEEEAREAAEFLDEPPFWKK